MSELVVNDLRVRFGATRAVDGVTLRVARGRTLGLVGESGCGKSTLARSVVGLNKTTGGTIVVDGIDVGTARGRESKLLRKSVQMVFQDATSALNPRMSVAELLGEPMAIHRQLKSVQRTKEISTLLDLVGLPLAATRRFPHEFSGGQCQRIAIARALAVEPKFLVLDEVTSALDVSVQALVLNLLNDLQKQLDLGYLFISHNLAVVKAVSDEVAVMYLGKIMERGAADRVLLRSEHPYTQALVASIPTTRSNVQNRVQHEPLIGLGDTTPDPTNPPSGCRWHPRCSLRASLPDGERELCTELDPSEVPELVARGVNCHFADRATLSPRSLNSERVVETQ